MIPQAEALLLTTGLLKLPDRTTVRAARAIEKELAAEFTAVLKRETPGRLYAIQSPRNYYDRLLKFVPDYGELIETLGPDLGVEFQLAQMAGRNALDGRYPKLTLDTVLGERPIEASELEVNLYVIYADTVEDYLRLCHDFAAGVLAPQQVLLFKEVYPETYKFIVSEINLELAKMAGKDPEWLPPLWLSDSIKVLRGTRLGTMVRKEVKAETTGSPTKIKLDDAIAAMKTVTDS